MTNLKKFIFFFIFFAINSCSFFEEEDTILPGKRENVFEIEEEIIELREAITSKDNDRIADEMGDVIFSFVNLSRYLEIDPESSVRYAISKFSNRFKKVEQLIEKQGKKMDDTNLEELDILWNKIKKQ